MKSCNIMHIIFKLILMNFFLLIKTFLNSFNKILLVSGRLSYKQNFNSILISIKEFHKLFDYSYSNFCNLKIIQTNFQIFSYASISS